MTFLKFVFHLRGEYRPRGLFRHFLELKTSFLAYICILGQINKQAASCKGEGFKGVKLRKEGLKGLEKFEVGKVRQFEKFEKIDVTKVRSWKCSKIIINVAYTNRPTLSF